MSLTQSGYDRTQIRIETPRLLLRPLRPVDATERYLGWFPAPHVQARPRDVADLRAYILERERRDDVLFLGIFNADRHIGNIKYEPVDSVAGYAVMGVLIAPEWRGMGIMPEALKASAWWLRDNRGVREIDLGVHVENVAAIRNYRKVGFVVEDTPHTPRPEGGITMVWHL